MRLLFICPVFNDYHNLLSDEMTSLNFKVTHFADKPQGIIYRISAFISSAAKLFLDQRYLDSIIDSATVEKYDIIFVVKGTILDSRFMLSLRSVLPNAKYVMYQWDSTITHSRYLKITQFFDRVYTFDKLDAVENNFKYEPLFFSKFYENLVKNEDPKYDLAFVGEYYPDSDRLVVVKKIKKGMINYGLKFHFSLRVDFLALFKFIVFRQLRVSDLPYISIGRISQQDVAKIYSNASAVLDIEHHKQNGLTMRTMEVLGAGLKLVTTNHNICNEDFFKEDNRIMVIDRENPSLNKDFFTRNTSQSFDQRYSIKSWVKCILQH